MIKPMLCKLTEEAFKSPNYIWEPKLDGARIITVIKDGKARLFGRSGTEKTQLFPDIKFDVARDCILDGELLSGTGFNDLQHRVNRVNGIGRAMQEHPARYSVFDILELVMREHLELVNVNLRGVPLMNRKEILKLTVKQTDNVSLTEWVDDGVALFEAMKANQFEGVVGKSKTGFYTENKREWLKVKCWQNDNFLAVGYTAGTGWRISSFGALVLTDAKGTYVGQVGTGFTDHDISNLMDYFIPSTSCPPWSKQVGEPVTWFLPFLVKVRYLEKTNDGMLRFPAFKGCV